MVHLIIGRHNVNGELWAIVSNEKTTLQTFAEYGLRFDIEENFLDDQSGGWNVQHLMLRDVGPKAIVLNVKFNLPFTGDRYKQN